ncbi:hypothetical protein HS041_20670 [Planomonospora sp. ID67723]|uniref:hypothetical protein n=1 Tax=Planomonospora sp. ID67723 TaxID=2738134 RepID=UPI0018C3DD0D|nr:hypothetical protein [Planomonospora sp. ID67723]MBG0830182.1 hypothetical protein [Planomonospora sp. ID67723]
MELHDRHGGRVLWLGDLPGQGATYRLRRGRMWLGDHGREALAAAAAYHGITLAECRPAAHFSCTTVNLSNRTCCRRRARTARTDTTTGLIHRLCSPCYEASAQLAGTTQGPPPALAAAAAGDGLLPGWSDLDEWWLRLREHERQRISADLRGAITVIYAACENLIDMDLPPGLQGELLTLIYTRATGLRDLLATTRWAGL